MQLISGTRLGRYEIRSKIGAGGMGEVYLAQDTQLDRAVALKILPAEIASDQQRLHRFLQEARAASKLKGANVAHIYEIGEANGVRFIAMEYVEGEPLNEKMKGRQLSASEIIRIAIQTARALDEAHSKGVTHRDIKPQNIIVMPEGEVKVLDFGLAKLDAVSPAPAETPESELATRVKTSPGVVMGTVNYMSPEQAMGRDVDQRTDIFSLGVMLYEMATGRVPFSGSSLTETIDKIVHAQPEAIARLNYDIPAELEGVIKKALRKNRNERYQTAREMIIDLKSLQQEFESSSRLEHGTPPGVGGGIGVAPSGESGTAIMTAQPPAPSTSETASRANVSSAEYLLSEIRRHKKGAVLIIGALAVAVAGIAYGLYKFVGHKSAANLQSMKITRLTNIGKVVTASISPDGKYVAYSSFDESGQSSLWVRHVATTSNVQIVPPAGAEVYFTAPAFSPDGNYIYYIRGEKSAPGVLYQVPVLGGTSKKLLENVGGPISFSPDGKRFTFIRRYVSRGGDTLMVANADGTGEQKLAARTFPDFLGGGAAWSPDGKTIACGSGSLTGGYNKSVIVIQVADGTQKPLTSHRWVNVERLAWLADGSGVITTAQEQEEANPVQIWQISYPDGEAHPITTDLNNYHNASLTADSSTLVTTMSDTTSNVWVAPTGEWTGARQLTSGKENGGAAGGTTWTPDGKIVYRSRAGGSRDIWIMDADGRNQKQLTDDAFFKASLSVTADGRYIVFASDRSSGTSQLWRIDIDGSNLKQLTTGIVAFLPHCSPDSRWVVYTSFGASGFSIWKVSIDGGEPVQVTNKNATLPAISPDGKLIASYFVDFDAQTKVVKIALLPFEGGDPVKLFDLPQNALVAGPPQSVRWTPDGRALTYINTRGIVSNIWLQPIDGSPPKQLTDFKTDRIFSFDWSRDGKWLACSRGVIDSDVILISNFR